MTPVALEGFRPLVKRPDRLRVGSIEHPAAVAPHVDQAHLEQHPEVLRHRRLRHPQRIHNLSHRPLLQRQIVQNLPPPRLRHGIERIRRCRCSCHWLNNIFLYGNVSSIFFLPPPSPLTLFRWSLLRGYAKRNGFAIITADRDFVMMANTLGHPSKRPMGRQLKSEASSWSSAEVRRLWEEPTEAIPQNQREARGILFLLGRGGCQHRIS